MFLNVKYKDGIFYGKDSVTNKWIVIERSISFIYVRAEINEGQSNFAAVTFERHQEVLTLIRNYMTGITIEELPVLHNVYLRAGWYDKRANSLAMSPMLELLRRYRYGKDITSKDKRRITMLCKQLSISMRDIHMFRPGPDPINVMHGKSQEV